jgi:hypothetical protein
MRLGSGGLVEDKVEGIWATQEKPSLCGSISVNTVWEVVDLDPWEVI